MGSRPQVQDHGQTVVLDLHGATIDEAIQLIRGTLRLAHQRGRGTVRVIHGASTSDHGGRKRTIKNAFQQRLKRGEWDHLITGYNTRHGSTTLYLKLGHNVDHRTIRLDDIMW